MTEEAFNDLFNAYLHTGNFIPADNVMGNGSDIVIPARNEGQVNCPSPLTAEEDACNRELCDIMPSLPSTHSNNQGDLQSILESNGGANGLASLTDELEQTLPTF